MNPVESDVLYPDHEMPTLAQVPEVDAVIVGAGGGVPLTLISTESDTYAAPLLQVMTYE